MADQLFIRILEQAPSPAIDWLLMSPSGHSQNMAEGSTFAELEAYLQTESSEAKTADKVSLLVPSEAVTLAKVSLPSVNSRYLARALPFAIEEQLIEDVERYHLTPGTKQTDGHLSLAATAHQQMRAWLELCEDHGLSPAALLPDSLGLPRPQNPGQWSVLLEPHRALISYGADLGLAVELDNFQGLFQLLLEQYAAEQGSEDNLAELHLQVFASQDLLDSQQLLLSQLENEAVGQVELQLQVVAIDSPIGLCARQLLNQSQGLNLLHGPYQVKGRGGRNYLGPFKPLAWLAAAWLVLQLGMDISKLMYFNQQADEFRAQAEQIYRDAFPGERISRRLKRQTEGKLSDSVVSSDKGFIDYLGESGLQLREANLASAIEFTTLRYDARRSELDIELRAGSIAQLEQYKQALANAGFAAEISSATSDNNRIKGRLRVKENQG